MATQTKKISNSAYQHISSGLFIVYCQGEKTGYWNIWKDANFTDEYYCGLPTKWQCINFINNNFIVK